MQLLYLLKAAFVIRGSLQLKDLVWLCESEPSWCNWCLSVYGDNMMMLWILKFTCFLVLEISDIFLFVIFMLKNYCPNSLGFETRRTLPKVIVALEIHR